MTNQEIQIALLKYAKSDVNLCAKKGYMSITDTKKGLISLTSENGSFQAFNNMGSALTGIMNKKQMIQWVSQQYQVEIN